LRISAAIQGFRKASTPGYRRAPLRGEIRSHARSQERRIAARWRAVRVANNPVDKRADCLCISPNGAAVNNQGWSAAQHLASRHLNKKPQRRDRIPVAPLGLMTQAGQFDSRSSAKPPPLAIDVPPFGVKSDRTLGVLTVGPGSIILGLLPFLWWRFGTAWRPGVKVERKAETGQAACRPLMSLIFLDIGSGGKQNGRQDSRRLKDRQVVASMRRTGCASAVSGIDCAAIDVADRRKG
jgi:hypothetical protein